MISNPTLYQKFLTLTLDYISLRKISSFMICTQIFSTNNNIFDSLRGVVSQYFDPNYGILYSSLLQTWLDKLVTAMFGFWVVYITCSSLFSHFVFACNAKSFTIASLVFFFFFLYSSLFLDGLSSIFLGTFYHSLNRKRMTKIRLFRGHTKSFLKNCSLTCFSRRVWHVTWHVL